MSNEDLLKALRDTVRAERSELQAKPHQVPEIDAALIDRMTDAAMRELTGEKPAKPIATLHAARKKRVPPWLTWSLPAVAAAAACLLFLTRPQAALPLYQSELVSGFESRTRGAASEQRQIVFRSQRTFELALRPSERANVQPEVAVFLKHAGARAPLPSEVDVGAFGTVHVRGRLPQSLPEPGPWSLEVLLAPPGHALGEPASGDDLNTSAPVQRFEVEIVAPSP